jgi:fumarylacetoacetase-like protein
MNDAVERAAQYLAELRRGRRAGPRLPEDCRPRDLESALAVQSRVGQLLGGSIGGWKCSAPTGDRIIAAPIYASDIHNGPRCPVEATGATASIEPEIAYVLARDLPSRKAPYTEQEVRAAIGEARLVLELIQSRYTDSKAAEFLEKLADSLSNLGLYLGPVIPGGVTPEMGAFPISMQAKGASFFKREGKHPDGHPFAALYWLVNFLSKRGQGLKAGDVITTGSYAGVVEAPVGEPLRIMFGDIGVIEVELVAGAGR